MKKPLTAGDLFPARALTSCFPAVLNSRTALTEEAGDPGLPVSAPLLGPAARTVWKVPTAGTSGTLICVSGGQETARELEAPCCKAPKLCSPGTFNLYLRLQTSE